jgi:predicted acylesterase/phospholipase RssA
VTASSARTHTAGPLWRYCRASMSILGYMPLLRDSADGHLLADGGYASNLPVEVMRAVAPQVGTVWAVDVENKANPLRGVPDYGDSLSGWYLLGRYVASKLGLAPPLRIPSLSELSLRVAYISHSMLIRELLRRGDPGLVYMRPPVGSRFGLLDYHRAPEIIAAGYEEATASLARWRAATGQAPVPVAAPAHHGAAQTT